MKALTIQQPYAELVAMGEKRIENRTWFTHYRGSLAIHAGLKPVCKTSADWQTLDGRPLDFGAIVAVAELVDCVTLDRLGPELRQHVHAHGPYCWVLANVRRLQRPIHVSGRQGLWNVDEVIADKLAEFVV